MTKRYLGNIITQNPTAPAGNLQGSAAKGVWSLEEQLAYQKAGLWPVPGNVAVDITDVFNTYLYEGNQTDRTITNGINLSEEGGLVWIKEREAVGNHFLFDTERPLEYSLQSNETDGQSFRDETVEAYNTDGFDLGTGTNCNQNNIDFVSWTFRKAPKFFTCLTYTGNGVAGREIAHDLSGEVGLILIKQTNTAAGWYVLHKDSGLLILNETVAQYSDAVTDGFFGDGSTLIRPTSSVFTLGDNVNVNGSGNTYIAYLFAHNDGDGGFGPDSDQDIIKCGSYTGGGTSIVDVDLGFEPQWLLIKNVQTGSTEWVILDTMRGLPVLFNTSGMRKLQANSSASEGGDYSVIHPTPTGFNVGDGTRTVGDLNTSGNTYIYMAIRRGPLALPTAGTEVFNVATRTANEPAYVSDFTVDMALRVNGKTGAHNTNIGTRITGIYFGLTDSTYQFQDGNEYEWDYMNGWNSNAANDTNSISWMWKRAPGYLDVVAYTGNGTAGRTVSHNLGVAPEMMWIKRRNAAENWAVYNSALGNNKVILLQSSGAAYTDSAFNNTTPTDSVFSVSNATETNASGSTYMAYLFATLAGVSKVGSLTKTSSSLDVDCGFTSGARFVLIKRTDSTGDWWVFDTVRGINSSAVDPYLFLNSTAAEGTNFNLLTPLSSGFTINSAFAAGDYIFYAIA